MHILDKGENIPQFYFLFVYLLVAHEVWKCTLTVKIKMEHQLSELQFLTDTRPGTAEHIFDQFNLAKNASQCTRCSATDAVHVLPSLFFLGEWSQTRHV